MKKNRKNRFVSHARGFTLLEILIVIFIVGIITTMLVVNWRKNERRYQLQRTAQEIAQLIRKAQGFALNGRQMFWSPTGEWLVPEYYGVHLDKTNPTLYFIYGQFIGNPGYQNPEEIEETFTYTESDIVIDSFDKGNILDIIFNVPDGFTDFYPNGTSAVITIKRIGKTCPSSDCKTIELSNTGQINIQ